MRLELVFEKKNAHNNLKSVKHQQQEKKNIPKHSIKQYPKTIFKAITSSENV